MAQAVSLKEDDVDSVRKSLDTRHEIACGSPAQSPLEPINRFARAVKLALAGVDTDDAPTVLLDRVDGNKGAVAAPADGRRAVLVAARQAIIDLFGNGRIAKGLCASALELRLLLSPSHGYVLGRLEVLRGHGHLDNGVKGAAHEDEVVVLGDDSQELLVGGPACGGDAGVDGAHDLDVSAIVGELVLLDRDNVSALQNKTCHP